MLSTAADTVFSIPLNLPRADQMTGENDVGVGYVGSPFFVGDQANEALKYFLQIEPGKSIAWPIVLSGASGTGKTALALSMASQWIDLHEKPAAVFSANGFRRRFAAAIDTDSIDQFADSLSQSSLLLVDNLHLLSGYDAVQDHLAALLDRFVEQNKPVLFTVSEKLLDPECLNHRLVSRLSGGLCVNVHPPGELARQKIISDLCLMSGLDFTAEAELFLARELKLTFPKINALLSSLKNWLSHQDSGDLVGPVAKEQITEYLLSRKQSNIKVIDFIIRQVADAFDLKTSDIKSSSRKQTIVMARGVSIYLLRNTLGISFSKIGEVFGGRDHSTIIHAENKIADLVATQSHDVVETVERIQRTIQEKGVLDIGG